MIIKEYPEIKKNGKTIVNKTSEYEVAVNFTKQMQKRGLCSFNFFAKKDKWEKAHKEENKEKIVSSISWSSDFTPNDMLNVTLFYLNSSLDPKQKMVFATQLQNLVLSQHLIDGYEDSYSD